MPKVTNITCDHCWEDLNGTNYASEYRLVLSPEAMPHNGNMVYATDVPPEIKYSHYFCWIQCLRNYLAIRFDREKKEV